jgi:uncharacterized caspase-like protein
MGRIAFLLFLLIGLLAASAGGAVANKRIALLVGNKNYTKEVGELTNPLNDIEVVGKALREINFEILPLLKDAKRREIRAAVADYAAKLSEAGAGAIGVLYYSGHGVSRPEDKANYLIPVDVTDLKTRDAWYDTIPLDDILAELERTAPKASHFVIFDACRSELKLATKNPVKGFVPVNERQGMFIALASAPNDTASDAGEGSGPYAAALAAELVKPGQHHLDLFQNVKQEVNGRTNGHQIPWERNGLLARVYFKVGEPKPPAPAVAVKTDVERGQGTEELLFWSSVKDAKDPAELKEFVRQFPESKFAPLAKVRIAALEATGKPPEPTITKGAPPKTQFVPQIIGGIDADLKDWPWFASLRSVNEKGDAVYFCQGSVIAPRWVLTVAHCLPNLKSSPSGTTVDIGVGGSAHTLEVVLGVQNLATVQDRDVYKVKRAIIHEAFENKGVPTNNVALLELDREWWGPLARLSLDPKFDPEGAAISRIPGFGHLKNMNINVATVEAKIAGLAEVDVPTVESGRCNSVYKGRVVSANICTGYDAGGKDSCRGNSGAPLVSYTKRGCPTQVGLVSWAEGCALPAKYSVHERVSAYALWIKQHVPEVQGVNEHFLADCAPRGSSAPK